MRSLRNAGLYTATISSFAERHSAWHWYAGYNEMHNPGHRGMDIADDVTPLALDWLNRHASDDNWFLHVNYWDPHTPYRTPMDYGNPFENDPLPEWLTEDVWRRGCESYGPHSAQEPHGMGDVWFDIAALPRVPERLNAMQDVKLWIDGYDTGIRYVDDHIGMLLHALENAGVLENTMIIVSADHAENQGELNVWGDHLSADAITCRIPLIIVAPGVLPQGQVDDALHYHFDWAASLIELAGGTVPPNWDGKSLADALRNGSTSGRDHLILSCGTWTAQRSIRFDDYLCIHTYHNGYRPFQPVELYNLRLDPHEQNDIAQESPAIVDHASSLLANWLREMAQTSHHNTDPIMTILREGGPWYLRGSFQRYLQHLRATGRTHHADTLAAQFPDAV